MVDRTPQYWREQAVLARQLSDVIEDPVGKQAILDVAAACDALADKADLGRMARE